MTQPAQPPQINVGVGVAKAPDGQHLVQIRVAVGPTAWVMELPAEMATQLVEHLGSEVGKAVEAIRRAELGVPGLILPNGHRP